ncbi:MAG: hypothetical protein K6G18_03930 [Treponema sp.]|nr:hypothetical protein [Treponema sp.]
MNNLDNLKPVTESDFTEISGGRGYEEALTAVEAVCSIAGLATGGIGWTVRGVIVAGAGIGHMVYSNSKYNPNRR